MYLRFSLRELLMIVFLAIGLCLSESICAEYDVLDYTQEESYVSVALYQPRDVFDFIVMRLRLEYRDNPIFANVHGVMLMRDTVLIRLAEYSEEQVNIFRNAVIDSPFLVFKQSLGPDLPFIPYPTD